MGVTLSLLSLIVLIPLSAVAIKAAGEGPAGFLRAALSPRAVAAYRLTFGASAIAATINGVFGLVTAWALVRYEFFGKRVISAVVDLPFALPTAVAGIALASLYSPKGWVGQILAGWGIKAAYNPTGVVIALTFIGLPFVVRTLEPVLCDLSADVEEAAASLGAGRIDTIARVILPALMPAWLTGFALAFARGVGEYGSVIFIAGNMPYRSEIAPLLIGAEPGGEARAHLRARRQHAVHEVELHQDVGVLRRDQRRQQRSPKHQNQHDQAEDRHWALEEGAQMLPPGCGRKVRHRREEGGHSDAPPMRTRGSSAAYARSTTRLMSTNRSTVSIK